MRPRDAVAVLLAAAVVFGVTTGCGADAPVTVASLCPAEGGLQPDDDVVCVPDPRPGDLRADPDADVLPAGYTAAAPRETIRDLAYGPEDDQKLDLYLPAEPNAPVIVFLHSGGWVAGSRGSVPEMVLRFVERGYAVASVGYRLAPEYTFPAPVFDVKRAIRWLKVRAAQDDALNTDRLVVYGTSAGGHLAAFIAATAGSFEPSELSADEEAVDSTVAGIVSIVGPTDLVALYALSHPWAKGLTTSLLGCEPCTETQLREASPPTYVGPDLPPAYWAYGADDELVEADTQGAVIAAAWAEEMGPRSSWLDVVAGAGHNIDFTMLNQRAVEQFIDGVVGPTG